SAPGSERPLQFSSRRCASTRARCCRGRVGARQYSARREGGGDSASRGTSPRFSPRACAGLLCDQNAVYDPLDSNDRLLLGMRGAMSEYELVTLRNRMLRGSRNKAERGELFLAVPVGYLKLSSEEIIQEPDEQARGMVQLVFDKFEELGSACAVFR